MTEVVGTTNQAIQKPATREETWRDKEKKAPELQALNAINNFRF